MRKLKPHKEEKLEVFRRSLKDDPAPQPFAFQYEPTESMKRRPRGNETDEGDDEVEAPAVDMTTVTPV